MPSANPSLDSGRSENLFIGLIIFFGLVLGYLLYSNASVTVGELPSLSVPPDQETMEKIGQLDLDFSVFDSFSFDQLKVFGEIPVEPGVTGKTNLFSAF